MSREEYAAATGERPTWTRATQYESGTILESEGEGGNLAIVELCGSGNGATVIDPCTVLTDDESYEIVRSKFKDVYIGEEALDNGQIALKLNSGGMSANDVIDTAEQLRASGQTAMLNLVYFFAPQGRFYPVDQAKNAASAWDEHDVAALKPGASHQVLTIDTGLPDGGSIKRFGLPLSGQFRDDPFRDSVTGHGPAIADLISRTVGWTDTQSKKRSLLVQVDATHTKMVDPGDGPIRGFTTIALISTLKAIDDAKLVSNTPTIVNMSFGVKACPDVFRVGEGAESRIVDPVHKWVLDNSGVTVVASSGNYGLDSRTYPAAFHEDSQIGARVTSVGALTPGGRRSCYSDFGSWVTTYMPGDEVVVNHPLRANDPQVWSGTSFAAPQVTGALAAGLQVGSIPNEDISPGGPNADDLKQCS